MLRALRPRLSFANVIACIALFVALGGSSFAAPARKAAGRLITGASIKNGSVTGKDIKNSSLTSSDIKNRSLLAKDFKAGQLPAGARGPRGATGATGARGAAGATNAVIRTAAVTIPANTSGGFLATARCAPGERATGGGLNGSSGPVGDRISSSVPVTAGTEGLNSPPAGTVPTGWGVLYGGQAQTTPRTITAYAVCVSP